MCDGRFMYRWGLISPVPSGDRRSAPTTPNHHKHHPPQIPSIQGPPQFDLWWRRAFMLIVLDRPTPDTHDVHLHLPRPRHTSMEPFHALPNPHTSERMSPPSFTADPPRFRAEDCCVTTENWAGSCTTGALNCRCNSLPQMPPI